MVPPGLGRSFTRNYIKADFLGSSWQDQPWLVLDCKANNSREVTAAPTTTVVLDASRPFICIPVRQPPIDIRTEDMSAETAVR